MQEIIVIDTTVCGRILYYPTCATSKMIADLVKQKYLTEKDLGKILKHNWKVNHIVEV